MEVWHVGFPELGLSFASSMQVFVKSLKPKNIIKVKAINLNLAL